MNLPTGQSAQKAAFFRATAQAMEFLAIFYELSQEQQEQLLQIIHTMWAKSCKSPPNKG